MANEGNKFLDFKPATDDSWDIDDKPSFSEERGIKISKKAEAITHRDSVLGPEIPDPVDNRTEEEKVLGDAWERSVEKSTPEIKKEDPTKETFELAKKEWRDKRDFANKLEADYARGYEKHVLESSKKLSSLPRRMFGLKPKLTPELQKLKDEADNARKDFNKSANSFLMSDGAERFRTRLEPKVAATLPYVHQQRREGQDRIVAEGWGENKNLRRALEALGKHKYKLTAMAIGVSALTTGGVLPVLAAMGAGLIVRGATKEGLTATYVESARTRLKDARKAIGENFLSKSYEEMNEEMENLTFLVGAREARTQTAAAVAGIAAGFGTAGYASGLGVEGSVPDVTSSSPEIIPGAPNHAGMIPDSGVSFDTTTPEGQVALKEYLMEHFKDNPEVLEQIQGTSPEGVAKGMERYYEESTGMDSDAEPAVKTQPRVIPETPATPESAPAPQSNGEDLGVDHEPVEDGDYGHEPNEEDVFAEPAVTHTVVRGDNAWNIMEGKGPDNNPVGGKSDVLEGMSLQERRYWLDKVFDYCDQYPDFAEKVGAVKSGGNIHLIHPGETINVSMLDEKIVELMNQEAGNNVPVPTPRPEDVVSGDPSLEGGSVKDAGTFADLNKLRVRDVLELQQKVTQGDAGAISKMDSLNLDKGSLQDFVNTIMEKGTGDVDGNLTVEEYFKSTPGVSQDIIDPNVDPRGEIDSLDDNSNAIREVGSTPGRESITVKSPLGEDVAISRVSDVNQMNLTEAGYLYSAANASDPGALKLIEEMGMDRESYMDMYKSLGVRGQYNADMTVSDWLQASRQGESGLVEGRGTAPEVPPTTPFGGPIPQPGDMPVREASLTPEAVNDNVQQAVQSYVSGVENGGILSSLFGDSIAGTFEKIADLNFGQIKEMAASGNMRVIVDQLGVTETGYEKWMNKLQTEVANNPALSDSETLRQYLARINTPQVAA